jgi:N-acetyl sugar amidotransferase
MNTQVHDSTCVRCVMDTSDRDIRFDEHGVCSHCRSAETFMPRLRLSDAESKRWLADVAARCTAQRTSEGYDSVIGLSGGVDSSYAAWLAHSLGMRPLAVHLDNGWNSELAVANIRGIIERCKFDLVTVVIDWMEFRDLQRAFIRAGVVDIEMLSDHAITASLFKIARRHGISTVLSGTNVATEHGMPRSWVWNKQDLTNILGIHRRFGEIPLKTFPRMGLVASAWARYGGTFTLVEPLNLANYNKTAAIGTLQRNVGWRDYGGKHYESTFTKFYQAFILPTKFGIDKRRAHLSALIRNGEITRDDAMDELGRPLFAPGELDREKQYVLKKLGFSSEEFDRLMTAPPVPHAHSQSDFRSRRAGQRVTGLAGKAFHRAQ